MDKLTPISPEAALSIYEQQARQLIQAAKAPATLKAYRCDWQSFVAWCEEHRLQPLPAEPETVVLYIAARLSDLKPATLSRRMSGISQVHQAAGHKSPTWSPQVRLVLQGARRTMGTAPDAKAPVIIEEIQQMIAATPETLSGKRDRALLLIGFSGAFRRSELVALDAEDLEWGTRGVVITIRRSKTDQEGAGRRVAIPFGSDRTCPVRALRAWLEAAEITAGAIFHSIDRFGNVLGRLTAQSVALIVKRYAEAVGLDPARYAGHSLRAGLCTSAAAAGIEEWVIAKQTGHTSTSALRCYIREGDLFRKNAAAGIGL